MEAGHGMQADTETSTCFLQKHEAKHRHSSLSWRAGAKLPPERGMLIKAEQKHSAPPPYPGSLCWVEKVFCIFREAFPNPWSPAWEAGKRGQLGDTREGQAGCLSRQFGAGGVGLHCQSVGHKAGSLLFLEHRGHACLLLSTARTALTFAAIS